MLSFALISAMQVFGKLKNKTIEEYFDFFEKTKNTFLVKVNGSMCAKFQVCIVFRLAKKSDPDK